MTRNLANERTTAIGEVHYFASLAARPLLLSHVMENQTRSYMKFLTKHMRQDSLSVTSTSGQLM